MSERPIEELIGWQLVDDEPNAMWVDPNGCLHHRAEVDYLAAWLIANGTGLRGLSVHHRLAPSMDGKDWHVGGFGNDAPRGPTIRDALIAAVRKVAKND